MNDRIDDDRHEETQRGQGLTLRDEGEAIQAQFPVTGGEIVLTQTRLYISMDGGGEHAPNVRLERSKPRVFLKEEWLEIAPRMGGCLLRGQTGHEFLQRVEQLRQKSLEQHEGRTRPSRDGIRRRYDTILEAARRHGDAGERRKMKHTLRTLHAAEPERPEAAEALGAAYLEEGNARAAIVWLIRAGAFDQRFDDALSRVERPRLPSREQPPPEWWIDRHLTPLLGRLEEQGPGKEQRKRIEAARERIAEHRQARGRAHPAALVLFVGALLLWFVMVLIYPWKFLTATAAATLLLGLLARRRDRQHKKRRRR